MAGQEYQVPDLASVLRTLASFAPPGAQIQSISLQPSPHTPSRPQPAMAKGPEPPAKAPGPKLIDPATITDWSSGLRCVMKTVAAHETIIGEIRRMMKVQHEHEEQWWAGREALLQRQSTRKESQKKLDEVLKAVGGAVMEKSSEQGDDLAEELRVFDGKVYRAQMQMVTEMSAKLKAFGVPFFGMRPEFLRPNGDAASDEEKKIGERELVELQRKMIGILEDLCSES